MHHILVYIPLYPLVYQQAHLRYTLTWQDPRAAELVQNATARRQEANEPCRRPCDNSNFPAGAVLNAIWCVYVCICYQMYTTSCAKHIYKPTVYFQPSSRVIAHTNTHTPHTLSHTSFHIHTQGTPAFRSPSLIPLPCAVMTSFSPHC